MPKIKVCVGCCDCFILIQNKQNRLVELIWELEVLDHEARCLLKRPVFKIKLAIKK